jgi:hypothetical protein
MKEDEVGGDVTHMREVGNVYRLLIGIPEEKRPLGRCRRRGKDNSSYNT